jgi:hypothetical protein
MENRRRWQKDRNVAAVEAEMMGRRLTMMGTMASWLVVAALALPAISQSPVSAAASGEPSQPAESAPIAPPAQKVLRERDVVREIDDPHSGAVWLLFRDAERPGGPGRLMLAAQSNARARNPKDPVPVAESLPVIRAGDALIVEEHSAVVDARLEAIALGSAARGSAFKARLRIGGKVVRVVALAPGRAIFAPEDVGSQ